MIGQEPRKHIPSIIRGGGATEFNTAKLLAVAPRPSAMIPGADDQEVLVGRIMLLEQLIDFQRTIKVFLIPPSRDVERRDGYLVQPGCECLALPERIIVRMIDEVVPSREFIVKILCVSV